jgi:MFS family permease
VLIGASVNGALPLLAVRVMALGDAAGVGAGTIMAGLRMGQSSGTFLGPALAGLVLAHAGLDAGWLAQAGCLVLSLVLHELAARATQRGAGHRVFVVFAHPLDARSGSRGSLPWRRPQTSLVYIRAVMSVKPFGKAASSGALRLVAMNSRAFTACDCLPQANCSGAVPHRAIRQLFDG